MKNFFHTLNIRIVRALTSPVHRGVIIALGVYTICWGLWLISPFWSAFSGAALYSSLASLAPESFWGIIALFCGITTVWAVKKHSYLGLRIGGAVAAWHWLMITVFYLLGDWTNTGGLTTAFLTLYAVYVVANVKLNRDKLDF